jgi:transcriptional regulator with XRE-family HTH domain
MADDHELPADAQIPLHESKAAQQRKAGLTIRGRPLTYDIGQRISAARSAKGWTQAELAEKLGKSRGTVVQYEQGNIEPPIRQIQQLADLLDVAPELLAFGAQGIKGLSGDAAKVMSVPELQFRGPDELISGAFGLPESLIREYRLHPEHSGVLVLENPAPAFGLRAGDRILVDRTAELDEEDKLYVLKSPRGVDLVKLLPRLSADEKDVKINDSGGETRSYERRQLDVIGRVVAIFKPV